MHAMHHLDYECKTSWGLELTKYVVSIAGLVDIDKDSEWQSNGKLETSWAGDRGYWTNMSCSYGFELVAIGQTAPAHRITEVEVETGQTALAHKLVDTVSQRQTRHWSIGHVVARATLHIPGNPLWR
ncbi:hypothetical protein MTR_8g041845 [Medicago truncatula]|uniref:Uncharacterized protein n=1 Tax=Medicago truncatula TaxID=3880 RepID=A0A072TQL9_MEDTR|nr:hypothetical protein MTR_8g041845 [Medicago truncatula]